jgi:heme/copper-type cytochrome/quinol oxidase subunit 2
MTDTQLLNDALMTVAFIVGLVVAISAWVVVASALHRRQAHTTHTHAIEQHLEHLADDAQQSTALAR